MASNRSRAIRAFSKCRNEILRLPAFLRHYRNLGVERFFIVDNDSTDGSDEYLAAQADVQLARTSGRFSEARGGTEWVNALLAEFGIGAWCVTVDVDELLVYPGSEDMRLPALTDYLDAHDYQALACLLLDMYPPGPLRDATYTAGGDPVNAAPYFDPAPYSRTPVEMCPGVLVRGGVRERLFYPEYRRRGLGAMASRLLHRSPPPCLTKVPLVRWDRDVTYLDCNHWVSPRTVAPDTGVLLHFKLLHDFHSRAVHEAARGEYYDGASEYRRYADTLRTDANLTMMDERSTRFEGSDQLVRLGLMHESDAWARERNAARRSDRRESAAPAAPAPRTAPPREG